MAIQGGVTLMNILPKRQPQPPDLKAGTEQKSANILQKLQTSAEPAMISAATYQYSSIISSTITYVLWNCTKIVLKINVTECTPVVVGKERNTVPIQNTVTDSGRLLPGLRQRRPERPCSCTAFTWTSQPTLRRNPRPLCSDKPN